MSGHGLAEVMEHCRNAQIVLVKMYESSGRLTVAAPMPGLEPEDICVEVTPGNQLVLYGSSRGSLKDEKVVHADEWNPGPYCREITLPVIVDGATANLTYRNGILVVALPVAQETRAAHLGLHLVGPDYGERVGNAGHPVHAVRDVEHEHLHAAGN